jgi:hypothetical protein
VMTSVVISSRGSDTSLDRDEMRPTSETLKTPG